MNFLQKTTLLFWMGSLIAASPAIAADREARSAGDGPGAEVSAARANWLNLDWSHRVLVSVNDAALDESAALSNFPLVLDGTVLDSSFDHARSDGGDIVVTGADGITILPTEVVHYDPSSSSAEVWFQADVLSRSANEFYVYYGNQAAAPSTTGEVWPADYLAVYHFEENPGLGILKDWTAAGNHGRSDQGISDWKASDVDVGILGQAWKFDGTTHFINTNRVRSQDAGYTVSAWMKHANRSTDFAFQSNPGFWHVSSQASNATHNIQWQDFDTDVRWGPNPIPLDVFHHFVWVFSPGEKKVKFYYNGAERQPESFWPPETPPDYYDPGYPLNPDGSDLVGIMGPIFHNALDLMSGLGDEFRISDDEKTAVWIATEYANQSAPSAFYTVGNEELPTPVDPQSTTRMKRRYSQ